MTSQKTVNTRPVLVIGCSEKKLEGANRCFDLYQGAMFQLIRSQLAHPLQHFKIVILSAKHGLIDGETIIENYDQRMPGINSPEALDAFVAKHKASSRKLLNSVSKGAVDLFVLLTKDYQRAFDRLLGTEEQTKRMLTRFSSCYISRGHRGIGELRGRLSRVLQNGMKALSKEDYHFYRSGVSNPPEIGYLSAGCSVGTSLKYVNTNQSTELLSVLLNSTRSRRLFIDNGLISLINANKGKTNSSITFDTQWVFDQYNAISCSLPLKQAKNLSIVIPDDVECGEKAIDIIKNHKRDILTLANRVDVILPIHKHDNIGDLAMRMMKELNFSRKIRLGIPCLVQPRKNINLALTESQIDTLLSLKHPKGGKLFQKLHFFGMSDVTPKLKLNTRLRLAQLHGYSGEEVTLDCCRTTALFGSQSSGLRKGSFLVKEKVDLHAKEAVLSHDVFIQHSYRKEFFQSESEPVCTVDLYNLINRDEVHLFWEMFNELMKDLPMLQMHHVFLPGEEEESMSMAWDLTSTQLVDRHLFEKLKLINWEHFRFAIKSLVELDAQEARYDVIRELFSSNASPEPVQMPLMLSA